MTTTTEVIELSSDSEDDIIEIPSEANGRNKENDEKKILEPNGINISSATATNGLEVETEEAGCSRNPIGDINERRNAVNKLLDVITPLMEDCNKEKIAAKINRKLNFLTENIGITAVLHKILIDKFEDIAAIISSDSNKVWRQLEELLKMLAPDNAKKLNVNIKSRHEPPDPKSKSEAKLRKKIIKLEKKLKNLEEQIHLQDQKEVDLEDETNSAYLVKTRMINHYMRHWNMLCELQNFNKLNTGRPIQKKIPSEDVTKYPEINEAVYHHLNSRVADNSHYFPDFHDIVKLVDDVRNTHSIFLSDSDTRDLAREVFVHIVKVLQKRRQKDFQVALVGANAEDPADSDPDLLRKLEENRSKGKHEEDVIREFVQKQNEMSLEADEVIDEDPDASPVCSDSENDVGEDGDENGDNESEVEDLSGSDNETDVGVSEPTQNGTHSTESDKETSDEDIDLDTVTNKRPRLDPTIW